MIISIGTDIIEIQRIRQTLDRTPRFGERVFTQAERAYCESRGVVAAQHYAARFAAKEATLKALGTGWANGIAWQDVEVCSSESGAPFITLRNLALERLREIGADTIHLSMSHTNVHALAFVVLERAGER